MWSGIDSNRRMRFEIPSFAALVMHHLRGVLCGCDDVVDMTERALWRVRSTHARSAIDMQPDGNVPLLRGRRTQRSVTGEEDAAHRRRRADGHRIGRGEGTRDFVRETRHQWPDGGDGGRDTGRRRRDCATPTRIRRRTGGSGTRRRTGRRRTDPCRCGRSAQRDATARRVTPPASLGRRRSLNRDAGSGSAGTGAQRCQPDEGCAWRVTPSVRPRCPVCALR